MHQEHCLQQRKGITFIQENLNSLRSSGQCVTTFVTLYYAPHFTIFTDSNPLTYILTTAKLNATGHRWVAELADFDFSIKYRPGKIHKDADTMLRLPLKVEDYSEQIPQDEVKRQPLIATVSTDQSLLDLDEHHLQDLQFSQFTSHDLLSAQQTDSRYPKFCITRTSESIHQKKNAMEKHQVLRSL